MQLSPLISPQQLKQACRTAGTRPTLFDCRHSLADPDRGPQDYLKARIPGALYAHLDRDLSGTVVPGATGRHPLPQKQAFVARLGSWGLAGREHVVVYDDAGGAMAARLWWMLQWVGHQGPVQVLDGGFPAWQSLGFATECGTAEPPLPQNYAAQFQDDLIVNADEVARLRLDGDWVVADARGAQRFRGEVEPIDPIAGHIPGAINVPFMESLDEQGCMKSSAALAQRFGDLLAHRPPQRFVAYCGSGVTAAHLLLAMTFAGLGGGKLYPGSWSEWITDPGRSVAGAAPASPNPDEPEKNSFD